MEKGGVHGLFKCVLGWWINMCIDSDIVRQNKNDAGTNYGSLSLSGTVIVFFGWFEPMQKFAGAGVSVPLLGFGNVLIKGVKEAIDKEGFLGMYSGGFTAGAVGISAALIFGYLASLCFKPKSKK